MLNGLTAWLVDSGFEILKGPKTNPRYLGENPLSQAAVEAMTTEKRAKPRGLRVRLLFHLLNPVLVPRQSGADPVGSGFVAGFPKPGGNVTGFVVTDGSLGGKWLELLKEIAPRVSRVAMLFNPAAGTTFTEFWLSSFKAAAASFVVEAIPAPVRDKSELESVVAAQTREPNGGLIVMPDLFTDAHRLEITSLAARYGLPTIYAWRFFTVLGGLMSYGIDMTDNFRRAATYADRILKGEKPADLPVQAPTKYLLTINLRTAKALGLDVPLQLQQRADEVIE